jgi:hexosaminidase
VTDSRQPGSDGVIIPQPASVGQPGPPVELADGCVIACDPGVLSVGEMLRSWLAAATGWHISVSGPSAGAARNLIQLRLDERTAASEGYELSARDGVVTITAASPAGVFYGTQTLRLLLPPEFLRSAPAGDGSAGGTGSASVPGVLIHDKPRLAWRGVHLDVARHFMPRHWILRLIDLLALHKLNVLHLHLTDDQGWRVEIERYPRLTEVGAWRRESPLGHNREGRFDGVPHGGYYTKNDLREIIEYAARRFVTVVPEIDMPGHMQAAIAAYPRLGNSAEPVEVWCSWGISPRVLNLEDETIQFCHDVLDEIIDVFPGRYVHLGGDECPTREWEHSPIAQQRMAKLGLADERYLQGWFTDQVVAHVTARGRTAVLWDEALEAGAPPDAVIMAWRSDVAGWYAAAAGHQVVMAPIHWTYLDWAQDSSNAEPVAIHATTSLRRVHAFDPAPATLIPAARAGIMGAQCQLWTEYVPDPARAEYWYFPRLCAFAEVAWSPGGGEFGEFEARLAGHLARLEVLGVNYRPLSGPTPGQMRSWPPGASDISPEVGHVS